MNFKQQFSKIHDARLECSETDAQEHHSLSHMKFNDFYECHRSEINFTVTTAITYDT